MGTPVILLSGQGLNTTARIFPSMEAATRWIAEDAHNGERYTIIRNCLSYMARA